MNILPTDFSPNYLLLGIDNSILPEELNDNKRDNLETNRKLAFENSNKIHEVN